jgi:SOS-response transcriptional repressor LexA
MGLHAGDAVSVDTRLEPRDGDLVVAEVELDGDSVRTARRYMSAGSYVRLEPVGSDVDVIEVPEDEVIVMGVIAGRLRFSPEREPIEEPLS